MIVILIFCLELILIDMDLFVTN